jgi:hypothetical protein
MLLKDLSGRRTALIVLAVIFVLATGSQALAGLRIKRLNFDPSGTDTGTNRHINRETVLIVNNGTQDVQLRGWKLFDAKRTSVYNFHSLLLLPGESISLHSGRGSDGAPVCEVGQPCGKARFDLYWGLRHYVWNNGSDRATLIRPNGRVEDRCGYGASEDSPKAC